MNPRFATITLIGALAAGCGATDSDDSGGSAYVPGAPEEAGPGATGVSQGGAQDFGLFRQILDDGEIPAPGVLDPVGFFAEHKLDYPAADCGDDLCLHGLLGVQRNMISGTNCTLLQIGLNTPIDPRTLERPPLDLVLAIDVSGSMAGEPIEYVRAGLLRMLEHLEPEDRVSLVTYQSAAEVLIEAGDDRGAVEDAVFSLTAGGGTNIYDGLFTAFQLAEAQRAPDRQIRVVLLSDGVATAGLTDGERLRSLAAAYAKRGIGITTIGVGTEFDVEVMRAIGELGAGNFYFLEDPSAVVEVFTEEIRTFLVPLALDVRIDVRVDQGYVLRRAYGTHGWTGGLRGGRIEIPSLFLAGRQRAADPTHGARRGGGGGILLELMPAGGPAGPAERHTVGELLMAWTDPATGERREQAVTIDNPNAPGVIPEAGYFTDFTVQKGFVMLNLLVGFQLASELAYDGDAGAAVGVLRALHEQGTLWLVEHPDRDIHDDLLYVARFISNLERRGLYTPVSRPPDPWPAD